jgi:UDPglucose 6-dehydrogenase
MQVTVIGLGFVGLTTALGFAEKKFKVFGYDTNEQKVNHFKNNIVPFHEPFLSEKLKKYKDDNFILVNSLESCIKESDAVFICVGTPYGENGTANLDYVQSSIEEIVKNNVGNNKFFTIVIKSTVPPSTTKEKIKSILINLGIKVGEEIGLSNNPEFLREGYAWEDFIQPDRVVIGTEDNKSATILENLYKTFNAPIINVSLNTAEYIKYLSNTLLSTMISYSNEMMILADYIGEIDIKNAFKTLHMDKRWMGNPAGMASYVFPGAGFGGYCLPKDTFALYAKGKEKGYETKFLKSTLDINREIKVHLIEKIKNSVSTDSKIGILGLAFKPESDDVRDTPAKDFLELLIDSGFNQEKIFAYDPMANRNFFNEFNIKINYLDNLKGVVDKTDVLVILTAWKEFRENSMLIKSKRVFDFRYILD